MRPRIFTPRTSHALTAALVFTWGCTTDLFEGSGATPQTADIDGEDAGEGGAAEGGAAPTAEGGSVNPMEDGGGTFEPRDGGADDAGDAQPPLPTSLELSRLDPADGAVDVDPLTDLVLSFNQAVEVAEGSVRVIETTRAFELERITLPSDRVTIQAERVTIDLRAILDPDTSYHVEISPGAFVAQAGYEFTGTRDVSDWNFTTAALTGPGAVNRNLVLWLDAAEQRSIDVDGEGRVRRWLDRSGSGNHASAAETETRPSLEPDALLGAPSVRFDGEDDALALAAPLELSSFDGFIVWQSSANDDSGVLLHHGDNFQLRHAPDADGIASKFDAGASDWYRSRFAAAEAGSPRLWNFVLHGPSKTLEARTLGGGPMPMFASGADPVPPETDVADSSEPLTLGNDAARSAGLGGDLAEVILFSRTLELADRIALTKYLRDKWGVDHPRCAAGTEMGFVGPGGHCLYARTSTTSWAVGRSRCQELGSGWDYASPRSAFDNAFATGLLLRSSRSRAWIGGTDNGAEGTWRWSSDGAEFWRGANLSAGGSAPDDAYANWASNEPTADADADCAVLFGTQAPGDGEWSDERCSGAAIALCEGPAQ